MSQQPVRADLDRFDVSLIPPPEYDLLLSAAAKNDVQTMKTLIAGGVPASHANQIGQTALHVAALWGHYECVKYLVQEAKANVNAANTLQGSTPLHTALASHKTDVHIKDEIATLLLDAGADTGLEDYGKRVPVDYYQGTQLKQRLKRPPQDIAKLLLNDVVSGTGGACKPVRLSRFGNPA